MRKKRGQSTLEYLIIWAAIIVGVLAGSKYIEKGVKYMLQDAGDIMEEALEEPEE